MWFCIYGPLNYINLSAFLDEITLLWNKATSKFENFTVMFDFNIDVNSSGLGTDKLDKVRNLFDMTKLVKVVASCVINHRLTVDLILKNRSNSSQKTCKLKLA